MSQDNNTSFLDPKMILVIVLCFGVLILWQSYMRNKYPNYYEQQRPAQVTQTTQDTTQNQKILSDVDNTLLKTDSLEDETLEIEEQLFSFKSENLSFDISNFGLGLRNILINKYKDKEGNTFFFPSDLKMPFLATQIIGDTKPLIFTVPKETKLVNNVQFSGWAESKGVKIKKTLTVHQEKYLISSVIEFTGDLSVLQGIATGFHEKIQIEENSIPLIPIYDTNSYYAVYGTNSKREYFIDASFEEQLHQVGLFSLDTHYFTRTVIDDSEIFPEVQVSYSDSSKQVLGYLSYVFSENIRSFVIKQNVFIGPKQKETLMAADTRLKDVLDYGFFSWIAHPIMDLVKFLYRYVGNWGVAIILMTLFVRLLLLPFNIMSYRSMKKLQKLQPKIKDLKEKYKDDKENLNKATMQLMKEDGANPLGGCLPMLLQIPVFFALFKVLGNAIEFYQAPFFLWITDLSEPDPYFVLPVLMALSMILHQMISPTSAEPHVKKMLLVVAVIFSLLMIFYPSGLALYIFIGSLFSIVQQLILMREKKHS